MITVKLRDGTRVEFPNGIDVIRERVQDAPTGATFIGDWLIVNDRKQPLAVVAADFTGLIDMHRDPDQLDR